MSSGCDTEDVRKSRKSKKNWQYNSQKKGQTKIYNTLYWKTEQHTFH
jgi:hypothetical protein